MDEAKNKETIDDLTFSQKHSFTLFVAISIFIASFIVLISMAIYNSSGAAQLDLSRPGYVSVRSKAAADDGDFQTYSNTGAINKDVINDFKSLFDKQAKKVKTINAFSGDPLDPDALLLTVSLNQ